MFLLGADQVMPRQVGGGAARRIRTYRPFAGVTFAITPWLALAWAEPEGLRLPVGLLLVGSANAAMTVALWALERSRSASTVPVAPALVSISTVAAFGSYVASGLILGYDLARPASDRFAVVGLLAIVPVVLALLSTGMGARVSAAVDHYRPVLAVAAVVSAFPIVPIPFLTAPVAVFSGLSVLVAAWVIVGHLDLWRSASTVRTAWLRSLLGAGALAQPLLILASEWGADKTRDWELTGAVNTPLIVLVIPPLAWLVTGVVGTVRRRSLSWFTAAQVAAALTLARLVQHHDARAWVVVALGAFAVCAGLSMLAVRRAVSPKAARTHSGRMRFWQSVEAVTGAFGVGYALVALDNATTVDHTAVWLSSTCFVIGAITVVYASSPGRLGFAYAGSLAISAGSNVLAADAGVDAVEVYTVPLAVLLAGIGFVQWCRNHRSPTLLTMGPSLSVLFAPTTLTAIGNGDPTRLALVTGAAVAVLIAGLAGKWKAPVTMGTVVLTLVAVTQGGPYIAYVPGWITLGLAGAIVLAVGVSWEKAVLAGRRTNAWYGALR